MKMHKLVFKIFLILFFSSFVLSDTINSKEPMAIGIVDVNCKNEIKADGFLNRIYRFENNTLQLFDINPKYKTGEINCEILDAKIYNSKGELLNITINKKNKNWFFLLIVAIMAFMIFVYKKSKNY